MPDVNLKDIKQNLLNEWQAYADASGLPLEYLIIEAVTFSVRSDRLGILHAKYLNERRKRKLSTAVAKEPKETPSPPLPSSDETSDALPTFNSLNGIDLVQNIDPSASSSEELEDVIPAHL